MAEPEALKLKHLFLTCPVVDRFWSEVSEFTFRNGLGQITNKTKISGHAELTTVTHCYSCIICYIYGKTKNRTA